MEKLASGKQRGECLNVYPQSPAGRPWGASATPGHLCAQPAKSFPGVNGEMVGGVPRSRGQKTKHLMKGAWVDSYASLTYLTTTLLVPFNDNT